MEAEASLSNTGWRHCDVVAWLAEQLIDDALEDAAREVQCLHDGVLDAVLTGL